MILIISVVFMDYGVGLLQDTAIYRNSMMVFQSEVAPLQTTTNHLLPNLNDQLPDERHFSKKRQVRTDEYGILKGVDQNFTELTENILFLGGSTTENNEVREEFRFPFLAISQLSKISGTDYIGINGGVRAHTTQNSINLYINHPSPQIEKARYVVMMHNINDRLKLAIDGSYKTKLNHNSESSLGGVRDSLISFLGSLKQWLKSKSNIIFIVDIQISRFFENTDRILINERILDQVSKFSESDIEKFEDNLRLFASIIRSKQKTPILMTQPIGKDSAGQDTFNDSIRKIAIQNKIDLIDLDLESKQIPEREILFFSDGIHFNDNGSKWAADIIAQKLIKVLKIKLQNEISEKKCNPIYSGKYNIVNQPLNRNLLSGRYPSLSFDGKKLLYQVYQDDKTAISVLDIKSGVSVKLLERSGINTIEHPTWLDSKNIIYGEKVGDISNLFLLDLISKNTRPLYANSNLLGAIANVSKKGEIAFAGYEAKGGSFSYPEIYYMKNLFSEPIKLTSSGFEKWRPYFNDFENTIYYIGSPLEKNFNLYKVNLYDKSQTLISALFNVTHWDPAISANGKKVAYAQKSQDEFDIFLNDLPFQLNKSVRYFSTSEDEWDPRFSADGNYLFYAGSSIFGSQIRAICLNN